MSKPFFPTPDIQKPSRYLGGEFHQAAPKPEAKLHLALIYPDVYEVGMSCYAIQLLYSLLNQDPDIYCERAFTPWLDWEAELRRKKHPLTSLETGTPLAEFDVLGFSLQHEMLYTNLLNMLDLSGIPLSRCERTDQHPLILAGGPGAYNPEPLADICDLFLVGDGEEAFPQLCHAMIEARTNSSSRQQEQRTLEGCHSERSGTPRSEESSSSTCAPPARFLTPSTTEEHQTNLSAEGVRNDISEGYATKPVEWVQNNISRDCAPKSGQGVSLARQQLLLQLAQIPGVYVPSLYQASYDAEGCFAGLEPTQPGVPKSIAKQVVSLRAAHFPTRPLIPLTEAIHERISLEVRRGCTRGCRFCQAGYLSRPVREREVGDLCALAAESMQNTGFEEVSLLALSTGDYSQLGDLVTGLTTIPQQRIRLSLPSLRLDSLAPEVAEQLARLPQTSLTFAPEAGSERLRRVINKNLTRTQILDTIEHSLDRGWQIVKLYFMVGLPFEEQQDLEELVELVRDIEDLLRRSPGGRAIHVSVAPFVPKPHTAFQWEPQLSCAEITERCRWLGQNLRSRRVKLNWHDPQRSFLEAVFARGDRRLGAVLRRAHELGARMDDWDEGFNFARWQQAFADCHLDPEQYAGARYTYDSPLPWDHIATGVSKEFLWAEHQKAAEAVSSPDCTLEGCQQCGIANCVSEKRELAQSPLAPLTKGGEDRSPLAPLTKGGPESAPLSNRESEEMAPSPGTPVEGWGEGPGGSAPRNGSRTLPGVALTMEQHWRLNYRRLVPLHMLSHLEFQRLFIYTVQRAGLKLAHSQGYHPHPKTSFGPPLPLGYEGESEWVDFVTLSDASTRSMDRSPLTPLAKGGSDPAPLAKEGPAPTPLSKGGSRGDCAGDLLIALETAAPRGLEFISLEPVSGQGTSLTERTTGFIYRWHFSPENFGEEAQQRLAAWVAQGPSHPWIVSYKHKEKERRLDIWEYVFIIDWLRAECGGAVLRFRLRLAPGGSLSPRGFLLGLRQVAGPVGDPVCAAREAVLME